MSFLGSRSPKREHPDALQSRVAEKIPAAAAAAAAAAAVRRWCVRVAVFFLSPVPICQALPPGGGGSGGRGFPILSGSLRIGKGPGSGVSSIIGGMYLGKQWRSFWLVLSIGSQ